MFVETGDIGDVQSRNDQEVPENDSIYTHAGMSIYHV